GKTSHTQRRTGRRQRDTRKQPVLNIKCEIGGNRLPRLLRIAPRSVEAVRSLARSCDPIAVHRLREVSQRDLLKSSTAAISWRCCLQISFPVANVLSSQQPTSYICEGNMSVPHFQLCPNIAGLKPSKHNSHRRNFSGRIDRVHKRRGLRLAGGQYTIPGLTLETRVQPATQPVEVDGIRLQIHFYGARGNGARLWED